jgi:SpoVK/Ycf46/Vps4 family AAA+-type ATPase
MRIDKWSSLAKGDLTNLLVDMRPFLELSPGFEFDPAASRYTQLSFYPGFRLYGLPNGKGTSCLFGLWKPGTFRALDGTSDPIHETNDEEHIQLSADNVCAYAIFFCEFVYGPEGRFRVIETIEDVPWLPTASEATKSALAEKVGPVVCTGKTSDGNYMLKVQMLYAGTLFKTSLEVAPNGMVNMSDDEPLLADLPVVADTLPAPAPVEGRSGSPELLRMSRVQVPGGRRGAGAGNDAYGLLASYLFDGAVGEFVKRNEQLFLGFEVAIGSLSTKVFTQYAKLFLPTIAIMTDYTDLAFNVAKVFAKSLGLELYDTSNEIISNGRIPEIDHKSGPKVVLVEHGLVSASIANNSAFGVTIPRSLAILARSPHVVLYVSDKLAKLPTFAENVVDIQLSLPSFDDDLLRRLLAEMYGAAVDTLPETLGWSRFVLPRDIARVARSPVDLSRAIDELRQTAEHRVSRDAAVDAVPIEALHGLGEARDIAQDLIADIKAALAGHIKWSDVDRGMLLVGPPGTGKTTLARSISKSCGVNFVLASAASWQAEGETLGPHIQAIRETFRRARLLAPSIMFIDEIDSIGNRNTFSGQNTTYQTEVVNALLEEMQGFRESDGIVVIAATNHLESVDPALQRAGRLDRVINIPYPSIPALSEIYKFYLDRTTASGQGTAPIDCNTLARLSYGRTGADVEFFLRGARRRARRDNSRPMTEADVVAEIMDSPRGRTGSTPISSEELRRTAVHEAGHALMAITQADGENPIGYISIVPRGDGTGGFTSRLADTRMYRSFPDLCRDIRIALAGRAAEEIVFGKEHISGGAGGSSSRSDLAAVSRRILDAFAREGFSQAAGLLWIGPDGARGDSLPDGHPLTRALMDETRKLIDKLYNETQQTLIEQRAKLDRIAELLVARQEITGPELDSLLTNQKC